MGVTKYRLKDQDTSFFDAESGLSVTRREVVEVDTSKGAGRATLRGIKAGRLIEVSRESKSGKGEKANSDDGDSSDLPENFPGRKALIAGGFDSLDKVKGASDDELMAVVSAKTVKKVREATQ